MLVATAPYPMRHHLLREVDAIRRRTMAEIDAVMEQALDARLDALAEEASQYDMPRILTGHFTVTGAAFGSERSVMLGRDVTVMLSMLDNPAWDYVALGHIHKHQCLTSTAPDRRPWSTAAAWNGSTLAKKPIRRGLCGWKWTRGHAAGNLSR